MWSDFDRRLALKKRKDLHVALKLVGLRGRKEPADNNIRLPLGNVFHKALKHADLFVSLWVTEARQIQNARKCLAPIWLCEPEMIAFSNVFDDSLVSKVATLRDLI